MKALLGNHHLLRRNMFFKMIGLLSLHVVFLNAACFASNTDLISDEEKKVNSLNSVLMCPVCPGESIDQSQNEIATNMRTIVKDFVEDGRSEQEIKEYFVGKYGPVILLEPATSGISIYAWIIPPIGLGFAIIVVILAINVMRRRQNSAGPDHTYGLTEDSISEDEKEKYFSVIDRISNE
ncbi:cytochrome c-type biogenesis protein CcmH [Chloroflexi bacterium]|nr:cytochrome c-type biogenesis protein CcmH [Chloroflexota bacterium]